MSKADQRQIDVVTNGIRVKKTLNFEEFSVPSVVISLKAPDDESAEVKLTDQIPEEVNPNDIGFHPKHGGEFWMFERGRVVFSRTFEPGEEYITVYGVVGMESSMDEWLSSTPSIERLDTDDGSSSLPGSDVGFSFGDSSSKGDERSLIARLTDELDAGVGSADDRARIREELLGIESGATTAIEDLREEVRELAGTVESLTVEAKSQHEGDNVAVREELAAIRNRVEEIELEPPISSTLNSLNTEVETLGDRIQKLEAEVDTSQGASTDAEEFATLCRRVDGLHESMEYLEADVEDTVAGMQRNARDIDDIGAEVTELVTTVDALPVARLGETDGVTEPAVEVGEMRAELDELGSFHRRLSETLLELETE